MVPGTRLGPYEVLAQIGAGGMGEVYRARDTGLGRDVAIKTLPEAFTQDSDRLARFQREARALAALNHPNIAQIHGLEDRDGSHALVMELVEGPTLADRIARGPIPVDEALDLARQIAEALEAAHEQGIIHRDLKPANIKVRQDGTVKVLDFGLAKAVEPAVASENRTDAPTTTSSAVTRQGAIVGTAPYMAPEQAKGHPVDRRGDIWAFGCVLYEMLTGRRAFEGDTRTDVLARVLEREPDWSKLPAMVTPGLHGLLARCLAKDPKRRWRDIADVQFVLKAAAAERAVSDRPAARRIPQLAVFGIGAVLLALGIAGGLRLPLSSSDDVPLTEFVVDPGVATATFAVSPDGRQLAFTIASARDGTSTLWVRPFDSARSRQVPGTEGATSVFWSPDSRSVAFFAGGALSAVELTTGSVRRLCNVVGTGWGGSWSREDVILFSSSDDGRLKQVPAVGGTPVAASQLGSGEDSHRLPVFLPDGVHFLYLAVSGGGLQQSTIRVGSLASTDTIAVGPARTGAEYSAGHLLYVPAQGSTTLVAQPFDVSALRASGSVIPVAEGIFMFGPKGAFSGSESGALAYGKGNAFASTTRLTWFDRRGQLVGTVGEPGIHTTMRLSPDGQRLAFSALGGSPRNFSLWILDLGSGRTSQLTFDPGHEYDPAWSPDGSRVVFNSDRNGPLELFRTASNGGGREERLLRSDQSVQQPSWSHDGRWLVYSARSAGLGSPHDLWFMPAAGGTPTKFVESPFNEVTASFSPDDRWVAYTSNASGRREVYVRPFPSGSGEFKVSQHGGSAPAWSGDGKELFFVADSTLFSAPIDTARGFQAGSPQPLFTTALYAPNGGYVVTRDGSRFLVAVQEPTREETAITVTTNWLAMIGRAAR